MPLPHRAPLLAVVLAAVTPFSFMGSTAEPASPDEVGEVDEGWVLAGCSVELVLPHPALEVAHYAGWLRLVTAGLYLVKSDVSLADVLMTPVPFSRCSVRCSSAGPGPPRPRGRSFR